jgi:acetylornithine/succinyldiaminopimelate/putrescine aminotransferase
MPISAMLTRRAIFERAYGANFAAGESHNTTMGFNALSAVAGLAALELIDDALIASVRDKGAHLKASLEQRLAGSTIVREVRGTGFMLGVALTSSDHPWLSFEHFGMPELGHQSVMSPLVCRHIYGRGFFCFTCGHDWSIFRLQPRFDIPTETLDRFVDVAAEAIAYVEGLS